jgi:hypothetical protein
MEAIEIKLDEQNELFFNVQVEGSSPGAVTVRLVCESEDFSAVFPGSYTDEGEVRVVIPELKKNASFKEGKDYEAKLEVMVENRYFIPLKFDMTFKESVKVFAEVSTKTSSLVENRTKNQESVVEVKKNEPVVSAKIVSKPSLKETMAKRQSEIFKRLSDQTKKK